VVEEFCFLSVKVLESSVARFIASEKVPSTLVVRAMPVATSGGETEPETGGFPYGLGDPQIASSMARGIPSSLRRILPTAAAFSSASSKFGSLVLARSEKSLTAS
jgi:hypothetical protein